MTSVNPGPASTSTPNTVAGITPVNSQSGSSPQLANGLRLLAAAKGVSCAQAGDAAVVPILNSSRWVPESVVILSSLGQTQTPATAYVGVFTKPAGAAYTVLANAVLTSLSATLLKYAASANTTSMTTDQNIYVNVGTTTAAGNVDVLVYGYDCSP